jgi:N-acetylglucosamine-6-phosphate deacetylase
MGSQLIKNASLVIQGESITSGSLLIEGGKIAAVNPSTIPAGAFILDCEQRLLTPGLIDVHTHGIHQCCYHYDRPPGEFAEGLKILLQYGTTCVLPTVVPPADPFLLKRLGAVMQCLPGSGAAVVPGLHLEGPFVALSGAACPTLPGSLGLLDSIIEACGHRVRVMSISPDQNNILPVIRRLRELNIIPFITHTRASVEQTEAAIDAGAQHATHFYDVFPFPGETEPGVRPVGAVEAILADPRVSVDFICDGVHVHPTAIRAAVAAKGWQKVMLITDSNIGAGLPPGEHDTLWGYRIRVSPGDAARHATRGFLAGSALTMNVGMRNLLHWLSATLPPEQIWAMGTLNPARLLGLTNKGRIAVGADADLVLWDGELNAVKTWIAGECVFTRNEAS